MFDASKSTEKKLEMYNKYVDKLFDMVLKASEMPTDSPEEQGAAEKAARNVYSYVSAMGMSEEEADELCTKPADLRMELIAKLKERE